MVDKKSFSNTLVIGLLISGFVLITSHMSWTLAFLVGYAMFTANVYAITAISSLLVLAISDKTDAADLKRMRLVALLVGGLKLIGLMLGLYLALVTFRLSGFVFGVGALSSLVVMTGLFSVRYLKRLGHNEGNKSI